MKIGVIADSFRLPFAESIKAAASLGAQGVQKYMTFGDFTAQNLTSERVAEVNDIMNSNGLVFSAICGDFGLNIDDPTIVEKSKAVIYKAKELNCNIVTTHIGHITGEENAQTELMRKNARELGEFAASINSFFAAETGTEKAPVLKKFLDSLGTKGFCVNLDPANLVMCSADDPAAAVITLKDYIVHTHAKDGIRYEDGTWLEVPLGTGGVVWDKYLKALKEIGYDGYLTIEREVGDNPAADIKLAADFLRDNLAKI